MELMGRALPKTGFDSNSKNSNPSPWRCSLKDAGCLLCLLGDLGVGWSEFEASLIYIASSSPARTMYQDPVPKTKQNSNKKYLRDLESWLSGKLLAALPKDWGLVPRNCVRWLTMCPTPNPNSWGPCKEWDIPVGGHMFLPPPLTVTPIGQIRDLNSGLAGSLHLSEAWLRKVCLFLFLLFCLLQMLARTFKLSS